jgi:4-amino-4-deoxy-L-arabinose transferase-like glycosyltransferase
MAVEPSTVADHPRLGALRTSAAAVVVLTVVGLALRLAVASQDLFADELSTYWIVSTHGLGGVISTVNSDAEITPPLSFVLAWLSTRIDLSAELLRLPSVIAGTLTIPAVFWLGVRTTGRTTGLIAAAITALAPFMVYYSAEARGYAIMMAFVVLSTLALLAAVDGRRTWAWALYALFSVAAVYTHYTSVFVLAAQFGWVLWAHPEARRPALLANLAAAAAYIPWIWGFKNDLESPTTDILSALQPFDVHSVRLSLEHWSVGYPYGTVVGLRELPGTVALVLLALAVIVTVVALALRGRGGRLRPGEWPLDRRGALVFALALATPVGAAVFSWVGSTTVFSTRNLAASWPGLALAGGTLVAASSPRLRMAAAALALACFAIGAVKLLEERYERPNYSAVAAFIDGSARPGDVVIDESAVLSPGPLSHLDAVLDAPGPVVRSRAPQQHDHPFNVFDKFVTTDAAAHRAVALAHGRRIFLVTDVLGAHIERPLGPYRLDETRVYPGLLRLVVRVYRDPASRQG